jgi:hypothetical protein
MWFHFLVLMLLVPSARAFGSGSEAEAEAFSTIGDDPSYFDFAAEPNSR